MLMAILITLFIVAVLGYALQRRRGSEQIAHRPYRNRYSDATGAREDHLG